MMPGNNAPDDMDGADAPAVVKDMTFLHADVSKTEKYAWVKASQRAGVDLVPWVVGVLNRAAKETLEP